METFLIPFGTFAAKSNRTKLKTLLSIPYEFTRATSHLAAHCRERYFVIGWLETYKTKTVFIEVGANVAALAGIISS